VGGDRRVSNRGGPAAKVNGNDTPPESKEESETKAPAAAEDRSSPAAGEKEGTPESS